MNSRQFGEKVAALRKSRNMTQAQLAEQLNVSNKTISRWETGDGYPEITLLMPLAAVLGVTVDDLLKDNDTDTDNGDNGNPQENAEDKFYGSSAASKGKKDFFNFSEKEYKHKDISVVWPVLNINHKPDYHKTINHILNMFFYILIPVVYYIVADLKKYSVMEWSFGQTSTDGTGYFCGAAAGYVLIAVTFLLFAGVLLYNILARKKEYTNTVQLIKSIAISTFFTVGMLLNFTFIKGKQTFNSISGTTTDWINGYDDGTILNCDFFRFDFKIIMLTIWISLGTYIVGEIIIYITNYIKAKKSYENNDVLKDDIRTVTFKDFWKSLTIFNKIGIICILLDISCIVIAIFSSIIIKGAVMIVPLIVMLPSGISKVGLSFSALGLALGLLDLHDRQNKASVIILLINLAAAYILPLLFTLVSVGGLLAGISIL